MRPSLRPRPVPSGDDGFSLVEAVVALMIATVVFTALAFALIGGAKAGLLAQQNQQAGDVLNQAVEDARSLSYGALAIRPADLDVGEPARSPLLSAGYYNGKDDSTTEDASTAAVELEPLSLDANGAVFPHVTTVSQNGRDFTVRRYVTVPADAASAVYKRLTVVVTWDGLGTQRTRIYSTLVANTKRGLPLPDFKFSNVASLSQCRNPGSSLTYSFTIRNNGARDAWTLSPTAGPPAWTYYDDTDGNGGFDSAVDQALPVTAGVPSTGLIEPTTSRNFFAVTSLQTALERPAPYTLSTVFRATSAAQPDYWQELTTTTTVQDDACGAVAPSASASPSPSPSPTASPVAPTQPAPSCASLTGAVTTSAPGGTMVRYYPLNPDQPGNTTARTGMPLQRDPGTPPAVGSLYNYSTDLHALAGRRLLSGTSTSTTADRLASWTYAMPSTSVLKGDGEVTFYFTGADGDTEAQSSFAVYVDLLAADGSAVATLGSASYTAPGETEDCEGFRAVSLPIVSIAGSGQKVAANQTIRLRVVVTSPNAVLLAYGTGTYPMTLTLPYKSGLG
jgi:type II secretory pathway pseudopilin PulG